MSGVTEDPETARVRARIAELLADGTLPHNHVAGLWAGPGSGEPCTICGRVLTTEDTEYEFDRRPGANVVRLHRRCFDVWMTVAGSP